MTMVFSSSAPSMQGVDTMPLALVKKNPLLPLGARGQFATCAAMTKSFFAKAFPSPHKKMWGFQSSPTSVDDASESSTSSESEEDARGEICEIIVVAIQRITGVEAAEAPEEIDRPSTLGSFHKSVWGSGKWQALPQRLTCCLHSGATTKVSAHPRSQQDGDFVFDEKFVFERREKDAQYHEVTIDVSSVAPGLGKKHRLGQVAVNLDKEFASAAGPIYRSTSLTTTDGARSDVEVHYVLHRLEVTNATAVEASRVLTRSSTSMNDDEDMDVCGQIFPDLWYLC